MKTADVRVLISNMLNTAAMTGYAEYEGLLMPSLKVLLVHTYSLN